MNIRFYYLLVACVILTTTVSCSKKSSANESCRNTANPDTLQLPATVMKGWEVYSWPACGDWNYSVLYGSNALKNYNEVTGAQPSTAFVLRVWGKDKLKAFLSRVPAGQTVSMIGDDWLRSTWGAGTYADLRLPPLTILAELQQAAQDRGLVWQVIQ